MSIFKKKKVAVLLITAMCIVSGTTIYAQNYSNNMDKKAIVLRQDKASNLGDMKTRTDSYTEYEITDVNKIEKELARDNVEVPKGKKVKRIVTIVPSIDTTKAIAEDNLLETKSSIFLKYVIKSVTDQGSMWYYASSVLNETSGGPGGTITQTVSESVAAKYSVSVGVSTGTISDAVGFVVTNSFTVADSYSQVLADGESGIIKSWAYFNKKTFEVWEDYLYGDDIYNSIGYACKPNGVRFRYYEIV